MPTQRLIDRGRDIARILAGQWVEYSHGLSSFQRSGRVVGYVPSTGYVVIEGFDGFSSPGSDVTLTASLTKGKLTHPLKDYVTVTGTPMYSHVDPDYVTAKPIVTKRPVIDSFPHKCTRCGNPALIIFTTVECKNWRCANYYLI